ncbi:outer membrane beta-barrel protein [Chondrinema litorale]|uniref:outer membrane beta-barrel protein n=1 Tax=Chondrinema litorale TaxID=2994555 RepID=UPI002542FF0F|nr:outer membrane beta-barrel protein [Chondrinema litorale]UZR92483.1 outer membrane beta-barrel protein [Chondrinema litorale]
MITGYKLNGVLLRQISKLVFFGLSLSFLPVKAQRMLIGFKGGANFTQASVTEHFSAFQYTQVPEEDQTQKEYSSIFKNTAGTQFGIDASFEFNNVFGLSFEPSYAQYRFGYKNQYKWESSEVLEETFEVAYDHQHKINYVELPLFLKFSAGSGKIAPYVQAGGFINIMHNASKSTSAEIIDEASGGMEELTGDNNDVGIDNLLNKYYYGLAGSAGIAFNLPYVRIGLDVSYRKGFSNITDENARYTDVRSSNISFDVLDDIQLNNMQFSLVLHFPVNFSMGATGQGKKNTRYVVPYDMRRFKDEGKRGRRRN